MDWFENLKTQIILSTPLMIINANGMTTIAEKHTSIVALASVLTATADHCISGKVLIAFRTI